MLRDLMPLILIVGFCFVMLAIAHFGSVWHAKKKARAETGKAKKEELTEEEKREVEETAAEIFRRFSRRATVLQPDGDLPEPAFSDTLVGGVRAGLPGESWPCDGKGEPLRGLMQVNLTHMPNKPPELEGVALVCVFFDEEEFEPLVREYAALEGLVEITGPSWVERVYPVQLVEIDDPACNMFSQAEQLPGWSEKSEAWRWAVLEAHHELNPHGDIPWQCKVGGWPAPVQDPIDRPLSLQVGYDRVAGINLVDSGCLYLWRVEDAARPRWEHELLFY